MKKIQYRALLAATILFTFLAILTAIPMHASKPNIFGYYSHCSFVPWSTLLLLVMAGGSCWLRKFFR